MRKGTGGIPQLIPVGIPGGFLWGIHGKTSKRISVGILEGIPDRIPVGRFLVEIPGEISGGNSEGIPGAILGRNPGGILKEIPIEIARGIPEGSPQVIPGRFYGEIFQGIS